MLHPFYPWWVVLLTNFAFAVVLALGIPTLLFRFARDLYYLEKVRSWLYGSAVVVGSYGLAFAMDTYNHYTNGLRDTTLRDAAAALFLVVFLVQAFRKYRFFTQLHPQSTVDAANQARARLLSRLQLLDQRGPIARFEVQNGRILYANPAAATLFGYDSPAALQGMQGLELVHEDDRERAAYQQLHHPADRYEVRAVTSYGRVLSIEVTPGYVPDEPDVRICWAVDVTDHVAERNRLIAQRRDDVLQRNYTEASDRIIAKTTCSSVAP